MTVKVREVCTAAPWALFHHSVGSNRYWYIKHQPSGLMAASFDAAPCREKVADVKAKFLAFVADWPDMTTLDPHAMTPEEIQRVRSFSDMLWRFSATEYRIAP